MTPESSVVQKPTFESRVLKTCDIEWKKLEFIQQDDFKELPAEAKAKLKASIIGNSFTQPFYVWEDPDSNVLYCLDGKHRTMILGELESEGYGIPEKLPATFVYCKDKTEAARLVLTYSSIYAKITQQGLYDFIQMHELDYSALKEEIDIPDFSIDRYEQKFDIFKVKDEDEYLVEDDPDADIIVKTGDMFQLGAHRILCGSFLEQANQTLLLEGIRARIVFTDPPYNLPTNFFIKDNKKKKNHKDFAMGAGEMTDDEFAAFLESIMRASVEWTVPGSIHYIFMDWRHHWHMGEAGRRVYGSPIPKQVCVWNKDMMANGSFYRAKHELCFIFNSPGAKHLWNQDMLDHGGFYKDNDELVFIFKNDEGAKHLSHLDLPDRIRSNVWNYPSATSMKNPDRKELKNHPTPKPVAMVADAILDTTNPGDFVIDWFLGSGTSIIACEKTGRSCRGTDVEPRYIQNIIRRYISYCEKNNQDIIFKHINGPLTLKDFIDVKQPTSETNN